MKRIAFALLALSLGGALAFGQDTPAPQVKLGGYVGTGAMLSGNNGGTGQATNPTIAALDRNNGGPVDFRLNFTLDTDTAGLKVSFWNSTAVFASTNLQYTYAWASFLDKQLVTKVGISDDNTTASDNMSYGTNDVPNGTAANVSVKQGYVPAFSTSITVNGTKIPIPVITGPNGDMPSFDAVFKPAALPGLALDYFVPLPASAGLAGDAFGLSRFGAAYSTDMFKVTAAYMLDQVTGQPNQASAFDFGVKFTGVPNLTIRVEGSAAIPSSSSTQVTSQYIQDIGYKVALNDTDSVTPYIFVREFLSPNGIAAPSTVGANAIDITKTTSSVTDFEVMPAVTYQTASVKYYLAVEYAMTNASLISGAASSVYAVEPAITLNLDKAGAQQIELGGAVGTMGSDATDGNFGQNYGISAVTNYGQNVAYDVFLAYIYCDGATEE
jgi:hypothetical protein